MQADTTTTDAMAPDSPLTEGVEGEAARGPWAKVSLDATDIFWRVVPILFGLAAWLPQIWSSVTALSQFPARAGISEVSGGFLTRTISSVLGPNGLTIAGALVAGLMAYSIWALARAVGAPRWAAASVASLWVVSPLFGLAPSPAIALDDAAFGAVMTLAITASIWTAKRENSDLLVLAFGLSILAALLRPGAVWPAIAIGLGAWCASRKLEEGPLLGTLSSLCWAPGLFFAHKLISQESRPASLTDPLGDPQLAQSLRQSAQASVNAVETASLSLPVVLNGLLAALPFVLYGAAAIAGIAIIFLLGKSRRRAAIAGGIGGLTAILGAAGYGSLDGARLLLDPIFLGLAGAIGLILPALVKRYQDARRQSSET
jgi:hypothetical protein